MRGRRRPGSIGLVISHDATPAPESEAPDVSSAATVVEARGLSKSYGAIRAVDNLTFTIQRATITGFLGPNGAGKTTTMRLLLGLAAPTAGEALIFGRPYRQLARPVSRVGAVLESNDFDPGRSGRNHVRAIARATSISDARVDQVLEMVELQEAACRPVRGYSLGMRQRLGFAVALLGDPDLLVLDEPANGLDAAGVHWLRSFLRRFASQGRTVLLSSHLLAELTQTVDSVLIIAHGRLLAHRRLDELDGGADALESYYLELTAG
jgi:ABC-2 type transport system ATP-binding protein